MIQPAIKVDSHQQKWRVEHGKKVDENLGRKLSIDWKTVNVGTFEAQRFEDCF